MKKAAITSATANGTTITVVGTAAANAKVDVKVDGNVAATVNADSNGAWSAVIANAEEGSRSISAFPYVGYSSKPKTAEVNLARLKINNITSANVVKPFVTGNLFLYNGSPIISRIVTVNYRLVGATDWITDGLAMTDANGDISYTFAKSPEDGSYEMQLLAGTLSNGLIEVKTAVVAFTMSKPNVAPVFGDPASDRYSRFYDSILWVGKTATDGTVVGRVLPENVPKPAASYSISGTAASWLAINSTTGIITVSNAAAIPAAGSYSSGYGLTVTATNSQGSGSVNLKVNVIAAGDLNYQFIDGTNGSDSNDGAQPHLPRKTLNPSATVWDFAFFKRGSTFAGFWRQRAGCIMGSYGDMALPIACIDATDNDYGIRPAISGGSDSTNIDNHVIQDLEIKNANLRLIQLNGSDNLEIRRVYVHDNVLNNNSCQGMYLRNTTNLVVADCVFRNITGDNLYIVRGNGMRIQRNELYSPNGRGGDCLQITDEGQSTQTVNNGVISDNIFQTSPFSESLKGALIIEDENGGGRFLIERNVIGGKHFCFSAVCNKMIIRDNDCYGSSGWGIGNGANHDGGQMKMYDNVIRDCADAFVNTGFEEPNGLASWLRPDIDFRYNVIRNNATFGYIDRQWSGRVTKNLLYSNTTSVLVVKNRAVTNPPATGTLFTTQDVTGNFVGSGPGPAVTTADSIVGTCKDGQTVSVSGLVASGVITTIYQWRINGEDSAQGTSFTIPAGSSALTQDYMPTSRNFAELSCVAILTDVNGNKSLSVCLWPDGSKYKQITA